MQGIIDSGKYKVIEVLRSDDSYESCLCIDVMVNNGYDMVVFNTYRGKDTIREFLPLYYVMKDTRFRDFVELVTADGSISAVFRYFSGQDFRSFFNVHPRDKFDEKLLFAESMLSAALEFDLLDDRIAAGALTITNVVVDVKSIDVHFNYLVEPNAEIEDKFRSKRIGELLGLIFPKDRYIPEQITDFVEELKAGSFNTCVEVYSRWRKVSADAEKIHKKYLEESFIQYAVRKAKRKKDNLKRKN